MKNKKNNKGFSLVELIVVVAIMAVLVGVLAPAYLKYVENSRINKDETNLDEITRAVEIAVTEEDVYTSLSATTTVTFDGDGAAAVAVSPANTTLETAIKNAVGDKIELSSKKYAGKDIVVTITYNATTYAIDVKGVIQ